MNRVFSIDVGIVEYSDVSFRVLIAGHDQSDRGVFGHVAELVGSDD